MTIGAATDPYQPAEGRYRLTRACIVELARARTPPRSSRAGRSCGATSTCSRRLHGGRRSSVNVSVPTLDDRVWRTTEPGTAPPRKQARDRAPARRRGHPRRTSPWRRSCPASPTGRSSSPRRSGRRARRARITSGRPSSTSGPGTREHFLEALARDWPSESARYERLYAGRSYLPPARRRPCAPSSAPSPASTRATAGPRCGRRRGRRSSRSSDAPRRIAAWPKPPRSPSCSPTTTRSSARAFASRSSARPTSASSERPPTARRPSRSPSAAAPT